MDIVSSKQLVLSLNDFLSSFTNCDASIHDCKTLVLPSLELMTKLLKDSQLNRWILATHQGLVNLVTLLKKVEKNTDVEMEIWKCIQSLLGDKWKTDYSENFSELSENFPSNMLKQLNLIKISSQKKMNSNLKKDNQYFACIDLKYQIDDENNSYNNLHSISNIAEKMETKTYLINSIFNVKSDQRNELRPNSSFNDISGKTLVIIATSMLNTGKGGCIYFGVMKNQIINGIRIGKNYRDIFKRKVRSVLESSARPKISHDMYSIEFCPVVEHKSSLNKPVDSSHDLFMIKIHLKPCLNLFFSTSGNYYCRIGDNTQLASSQLIREKAAAIEKEICLTEIRCLKHEISLLQ